MDNRFAIVWEITKETSNILIKEFLKEHQISKTSLTDIKFKGGTILVNGEEVNVLYRLQIGDVLKVIFPKEAPSNGLYSENTPLEIVYEDPYILVINKPAGMSTIPSREHPRGSLANNLMGYYEQIGLSATAHIITRLDRDTSGLVLIAKHRHVHHLFSEQQKRGEVKRAYEAFASGVFLCDEGTIDAPIARKKESIIEREVHPDGQQAVTKYKVLIQGVAYTHLRLQLETGRTHQIRVHLSYLGHPLLGDDLYGGGLELIDRQALHCKQLSFYHPFLKKTLQFQAALPDDFAKLLEMI